MVIVVKAELTIHHPLVLLSTTNNTQISQFYMIIKMRRSTILGRYVLFVNNIHIIHIHTHTHKLCLLLIYK